MLSRPIPQDPMTDRRRGKPVSVEGDDLELNARKGAELFEQAVEYTPLGWKGPVVDVLDTYETCARKVIATTGEFDAPTALHLTALVLERKKWLEEKDLHEEASRNAE